MQSARSWQAIEVCLFALRCTAATVKKRYQPPNGTHHLPSAAVDAFFVPFFAQLSGDEFLSHPLVGSAAASLVGSFGAWINQNPQTLNAAVGFLLRGLQTSLQGTVRTRRLPMDALESVSKLCVLCTLSVRASQSIERLIGKPGRLNLFKSNKSWVRAICCKKACSLDRCLKLLVFRRLRFGSSGKVFVNLLSGVLITCALDLPFRCRQFGKPPHALSRVCAINALPT